MDKQQEIWKERVDIVSFGVIFSDEICKYRHLLLTNNGITEELLFYGAITTFIFLLSYIKAIQINLSLYKNGKYDDDVKSVSLILLVFLVSNIIIFPIVFSLFHHDLNLSVTIFALSLTEILNKYTKNINSNNRKINYQQTQI